MNSIIISAVTAWISAQAIKVLWGLARYGSRDICRIPWRILWAGGMPSTHSAVVTATTIAVLFHSGVESIIFGFFSETIIFLYVSRLSARFLDTGMKFFRSNGTSNL